MYNVVFFFFFLKGHTRGTSERFASNEKRDTKPTTEPERRPDRRWIWREIRVKISVFRAAAQREQIAIVLLQPSSPRASRSAA